MSLKIKSDAWGVSITYSPDQPLKPLFKMQQELKEGCVYFVRHKTDASQYILKILILEKTKTNIHVKNLDDNTSFRVTIENFNNQYYIIEEGVNPQQPILSGLLGKWFIVVLFKENTDVGNNSVILPRDQIIDITNYVLDGYIITSVFRPTDGKKFVLGQKVPGYLPITSFEFDKKYADGLKVCCGNSISSGTSISFFDSGIYNHHKYYNIPNTFDSLGANTMYASANAGVKPKEVLLTTEDGVEITDPLQVLYSVCPKGGWETRELTCKQMNWQKSDRPEGYNKAFKSWKHFASKAEMDSYIFQNKVCLSYNDLLSIDENEGYHFIKFDYIMAANLVRKKLNICSQ